MRPNKKIHILSGDFMGTFDYHGLLKCQFCNKPFTKIDEHTYEPDCNCVKKKFRVSVG